MQRKAKLNSTIKNVIAIVILPPPSLFAHNTLL